MARMILPPDEDLQPARFEGQDSEDRDSPERPLGPRTEVS
jgi:hypothetical protein